MKKLLFILFFMANSAYAVTKTAVTMGDGSLQSGTTGFHVSSGTVRNFSSSTFTWLANGYKQRFNLYINAKDPPYSMATTNSDNTANLQAAIDAVDVGGMIFIPKGEYTFKQQVNVNKNRIVIAGESSESILKFNPLGSDRRMFLVDGSVDNVTFQNFTVQNTSTTAGMRAFVVSAGATALNWYDVFITDFNLHGINLATGVHYIRIKNCRFLRTRDTSSTGLGKSILIEGSNDVVIEDNRFAQNDVSISIGGGTKINVSKNTFESDGDSNNTLTSNGYLLSFSSTNNLLLEGNYFEAENSSGTVGAVSQFVGTVNSIVRGNYFNGAEGSTVLSNNFISVSSTATRNMRVESNVFIDMINNFIISTVPIKLTDNYYFDDGVEFSSHSAIMQRMSDPTQIDLDKQVFMAWDPPSVSTNTGTVSPSFTVTGSSVNDHVDVFPPYSLRGMTSSGYVNANGTAVVVLHNSSTTAVDLGNGNWAVKVKKPFNLQ